MHFLIDLLKLQCVGINFPICTLNPHIRLNESRLLFFAINYKNRKDDMKLYLLCLQ